MLDKFIENPGSVESQRWEQTEIFPFMYADVLTRKKIDLNTISDERLISLIQQAQTIHENPSSHKMFPDDKIQEVQEDALAVLGKLRLQLEQRNKEKLSRGEPLLVAPTLEELESKK